MSLVDWFMSLGATYRVNPVIFSWLYLAATIVFVGCVAWLVKNYNEEKEIVLPITACLVTYSATYVYLLIEGENIPGLAYAVIIAAVVSSAYSTYKKVRE